jgi:hypothetical protein
MLSPSSKLDALEIWCRLKLRAVLRLSSDESIQQPWFSFDADVLPCIETFDQNEALQFLLKRSAPFDHFVHEKMYMSNLIRFDDDELKRYKILHAIVADPGLQSTNHDVFMLAANNAFLDRGVSLRLRMR